MIGGGDHDVQSLTVTTYDSAYLHMEHLGSRFGLIVFDECHHLPAASYALAARAALAPFRLGLTATPDREAALDELIGPVVYRKETEYDIERVEVELSPEERAEHDAERAICRAFVERNGIRMSSAHGWSEFIMKSAGSLEGRRAMAAYRRQRQLAFCAPAKLDFVESLLARHHAERTLLFTSDNATCYEVSRRFLIPAICVVFAGAYQLHPALR